MKSFPVKHMFLILMLILLVFLAGCGSEKFSKPDIKDDFCGAHINYQYCKCAFHKKYCDDVGMSKSEANSHVYAEYNVWVDKLFKEWQTTCKISGGIPEGEKYTHEYGIIEKDGNLYLNSKPGEVLKIETKDLPEWAQGQIATLGATIAVVGPPDSIVEGDINVLLNNLPIARINDSTAHGGQIVEGSDKIFVNGRPVAIIGEGGYAIDPSVYPGSGPSVGGIITNNAN